MRVHLFGAALIAIREKMERERKRERERERITLFSSFYNWTHSRRWDALTEMSRMTKGRGIETPPPPLEKKRLCERVFRRRGQGDTVV